MTSIKKKQPYIFRVILTLLILTTFGCASPGGKDQPSSIAEEAYIDLKQNFTLVVPSTWKRVHLPVSSPLYRSDRVEWQTNSASDPKSTFKVTIISHPGPLSLTDYLETLNNGRFKLTTEMAQKNQHPAGPALRWEAEDNLKKLILLIIEKPERWYLLTCEFSATDDNQLIPTIEKVISSFSILQN